jgi:glycosyltransferase involved in cell wall biosynthesis
MEIKITMEELRKRKLMVATPMYGGACSGMFARSTADLAALCVKYGIQLQFYYLFNESLITRARNYCADMFMRSDATHLMFIDSDIGFNPQDIIAMLALQTDESEYDVLAGPYPKKTIAWEKIKMAVDKGFADEDPNALENFVGDYVFNAADGTGQIQLGEPAQVLESGTGFMMIRRSTLEKYMEVYSHLFYKPDHVRTEHFDGSREILCFFDAVIDDKYNELPIQVSRFLELNPDATAKQLADFVLDRRTSVDGREYSNRYLSEDYMFCQNVIKMGGKIWLCGWMNLQHVGMYTFGGSLASLAQIGAAATADTAQVKRRKQ